MDLGTVKKNINARKYKTIPEAAGMYILLFAVKSLCTAVRKGASNRNRDLEDTFVLIHSSWYLLFVHLLTSLCFSLASCFSCAIFLYTFYLVTSIPVDDIRLVWTNCMTYNQDGSDFFLLAKNLSKKFEEKYGEKYAK